MLLYFNFYTPVELPSFVRIIGGNRLRISITVSSDGIRLATKGNQLVSNGLGTRFRKTFVILRTADIIRMSRQLYFVIVGLHEVRYSLEFRQRGRNNDIAGGLEKEVVNRYRFLSPENCSDFLSRCSCPIWSFDF